MKRIARLLFICALGTAWSVVVRAGDKEEDDVVRAKELYLEGRAHFDAGRYEQALSAFTTSFNLSAEPNLLYNLGITSEMLGDRERAIAYFELYLEELPTALDAELVKKRVVNLKADKSGDDGSPEAKAPSPPVVAPSSDGAKPAQQTVDAVAYYNLNGSEQEEKEIFWPGIALGFGGLLIAGGTITGIMAYNEFQNLETSCKPDCTDKEMNKASKLALATDLQFAFGLAAAVTGTVLWIVGRRTETQKTDGLSWTVTPGAVPQGGALGVVGRF